MDLHNPAYRLTPSQNLVVRNVYFRQQTTVLFLFWNIVYKKIQFFVYAVDIFLPPMQIQLSLKLALKIGKKLKKNFSNMQNAEVTSIAREAGSNFSQQAQLIPSLRSYVKVIAKKLQPTGLMQTKSLTFFSTSENKDFPFEDTIKPRATQIVKTFWNYVIGMLNEMKCCTTHHVASPAHPSKTN